jgi:hypothetical protein
MDRRLGEPLPHQLPNPTRANPSAINLSPLPVKGADVYGITPSFPGLFRTKGDIPTRYSPVCHSSCEAFDLHVLGLPPAFVLSQDQTLKLKVSSKACLEGILSLCTRVLLQKRRTARLQVCVTGPTT